MSDPVLDALNRDPQEMTNDDLLKVIQFLRKSKASFDSGIKPKKEGADINIAKLLNVGRQPDPDSRRD